MLRPPDQRLTALEAVDRLGGEGRSSRVAAEEEDVKV
jgi:hypothetical protein